MCVNCDPPSVQLNYTLEAQCQDCGDQAVCAEKFPAACTIYNLGKCNEPSKLLNIGLPSCASVQEILEKVDELLGVTAAVPLQTVDSPSVTLHSWGPGQHHLKADVALSADSGNLLVIRGDGLYAAVSAAQLITVLQNNDAFKTLICNLMNECMGNCPCITDIS